VGAGIFSSFKYMILTPWVLLLFVFAASCYILNLSIILSKVVVC
jgi:hypothetical protein